MTINYLKCEELQNRIKKKRGRACKPWTIAICLLAALNVLHIACQGSGQVKVDNKRLYLGKTMIPWYITYTRQLPPPSEINILLVPGEESELILTGEPLGTRIPRRAEIGTYMKKLDDKSLEKAKELLIQAKAGESPEEVVLVPGTPLLAFGLGVNEEEIGELASYPLTEHLPSVVEKFDNNMQEIASAMLSYPYRTLRGSGGWDKSEFSAGEGLKFSLTLGNSGKVPLKFSNPAGADSDESVGLTLFVESESSVDDLDDDNSVFVEIKKSEVVQIDPQSGKTINSAKKIADLSLNEKMLLQVTIDRMTYLSAGKYKGHVFLSSDGNDMDGEEVISGVLRTELGSFSVVAK